MLMLAAALCGLWTYIVAKCLLGTNLTARCDLPEERRLHVTPTPRGGGVGILVCVPLAALFVRPSASPAVEQWLFWFALPNGLIGLVDDWRPIPSIIKLMLQFGIAAIYVNLSVSGDLFKEISSAPFVAEGLAFVVVLWLVWCTNVFNFMDGIDGLAAVSGVVFLLEMALLGAIAHEPAGIIQTCVVAAGALLGFLILNRPPARIFMGDGAALFVGALLAGSAVLLAGPIVKVPIFALILVMSTFLFDATYTLIRRFLAGERLLEAHCSHIYQRLALAGWSHAKVTSLYFLLNVATGCLALAFVYDDEVLRPLLSLTFGLLMAVVIAIYRLSRIDAKRALFLSKLKLYVPKFVCRREPDEINRRRGFRHGSF